MSFRQAFIGLGAGLLVRTCTLAQSTVAPEGAPTPPPVETVRNQVEFSARENSLQVQAPSIAPVEPEELTPTNFSMLEDIAIFSMHQPKLRWSFFGDSAWSYDAYSGSQNDHYSTFSIGCGVAADYGSPDAPLEISGQYAPGYDWSNGPGNSSGVDQSLSVSAQWRPSGRVVLRATVNLREAPGTDYGGGQAQVISGGVDLAGSYALDPNLSLGFDVSVQPQYFSTYGTTQQNSATAFADLLLDPALRVGWYVAGDTISSAASGSEDDLQTGVRLGWSPVPRFSASASLGLNYRFLSHSQILSPDVSASLGWNPSDGTRFTAEAYSLVQPGYVSSSGNPQTYGVSITGSQLLLSVVLLSLSGGYELSTYSQGTSSNQTVDFLSLDIDWRPNDRWSAGTYCRIDHQSGQDEFNHAEFGVNFTIHP